MLLFEFLMLGCESSLYILDINPLSYILLASISSYSVCGLFAQGPSKSRTSLVVHWLRLCASNAAGHRASLEAQLVKNPSAMWEIKPRFDPWIGKIPWRREQNLFWRREYPLQYSGLENSMESHGLYSPWSHKESDATA